MGEQIALISYKKENKRQSLEIDALKDGRLVLSEWQQYSCAFLLLVIADDDYMLLQHMQQQNYLVSYTITGMFDIENALLSQRVLEARKNYGVICGDPERGGPFVPGAF